MIKIVLLDENEEGRRSLGDYLKGTGKFAVVGEGCDGQSGLESILKEKPDAVVMDIVLENFDGYEVLERLRGVENKPKVIVLSSLKNEGFAQKAVDMGAEYVLAKPVDNSIVAKRIEDLLGQGEAVKITGKRTPKNRVLEEKISNIFITVGIPAHIKGYQFLREAIKMAIEEPDIINSITKQLYPSIATRFSTSASKVERAIRHAIEVAWNRGKIENINNLFGIKVYDSNEKPTNGEFIALVADKMLVEGA